MEEKEKKKGSPLMLVVVLLLVIIAGGGFFAFRTMAQAAEPKKVVAPKRAVVKVGEFVTNLAGPDRRFVKVTMDMELEDDETAKELATKTSQMRDSVLLVLRSRTAGELSGPDGMKKLGSDLLDKANTILKSGKALSIYFTEFTIQ